MLSVLVVIVFSVVFFVSFLCVISFVGVSIFDFASLSVSVVFWLFSSVFSLVFSLFCFVVCVLSVYVSFHASIYLFMASVSSAYIVMSPL